jgi:hypothetical protein
MTKYFVVTVETPAGRKFVGSPSSILTADPNEAGCITDDFIDEVFGYWNIQSGGKADILKLEEFEALRAENLL